MARTRTNAADGKVVARKARTARHRPCAEVEVVVVDALDVWVIALFPVRRMCKWEQACEVRERSTEGNRGKTQVKFVTQAIDRDGHRRGRHFRMWMWGCRAASVDERVRVEPLLCE